MEDYFTIELITKYKTSPLKAGRLYNADEEDQARKEYERLMKDNHVIEMSLSKIYHHCEVLEDFKRV